MANINETANESDEMILFKEQISTKLDAVGIILAAVYGVSTIIPISPFLGAFGVVASISFTICIAPLFGLLLGPYRGLGYGLVAGVLQAALATFVFNVALAVPTIILGPGISGFFTGLALKRTTEFRSTRLPGPLITAAYLLVIILLYEIPNYTAWWFMIVYMLAFVVALILQFKQIEFNPTTTGWKRYAQVVPFTLIGTATDFSMMTMGAVYLLAIPAEVFGYVIFPFMLLERTLAVVVSSIIGAIILATFRELWD